MTFEERLERLTERHEALTQSVELLLKQSREHAEQIAVDAENIRALARIAEIRERRLTAIEGEEPQN